MERFCGAVGQHIKNRHNPYASLDRRVQDLTQLQMVKLKYGLMEELPMKCLVAETRGGGIIPEDGPCTSIDDKFLAINSLIITQDANYLLLPPKRGLEIDDPLRRKLAATFVTRYSPNDPRMKISIATASKYIPVSVDQWGQGQIRGGGDQFKCRTLLKGQRHVRDCTYVKVSTSPFFIALPTLLITRP